MSDPNFSPYDDLDATADLTDLDEGRAVPDPNVEPVLIDTFDDSSVGSNGSELTRVVSGDQHIREADIDGIDEEDDLDDDEDLDSLEDDDLKDEFDDDDDDELVDLIDTGEDDDDDDDFDSNTGLNDTQPI